MHEEIQKKIENIYNLRDKQYSRKDEILLEINNTENKCFTINSMCNTYRFYYEFVYLLKNLTEPRRLLLNN